MDTETEPAWYVLRDLTRPNALQPAYKRLPALGFTVFTPTRPQIIQRQGRPVREQVPFIHDLLFVHAVKDRLDPVIRRTDTLQYRYLRGAPYRTPMTVADADRRRFITAVTSTDAPRYYTPGEITPAMYGAPVRIIAPGPLNGIQGLLLKTRGTRKRHLLIELPGLLAASIEIHTADYIQLL